MPTFIIGYVCLSPLLQGTPFITQDLSVKEQLFSQYYERFWKNGKPAADPLPKGNLSKKDTESHKRPIHNDTIEVLTQVIDKLELTNLI